MPEGGLFRPDHGRFPCYIPAVLLQITRVLETHIGVFDRVILAYAKYVNSLEWQLAAQHDQLYVNAIKDVWIVIFSVEKLPVVSTEYFFTHKILELIKVSRFQ